MIDLEYPSIHICKNLGVVCFRIDEYEEEIINTPDGGYAECQIKTADATIIVDSDVTEKYKPQANDYLIISTERQVWVCTKEVMEKFYFRKD